MEAAWKQSRRGGAAEKKEELQCDLTMKEGLKNFFWTMGRLYAAGACTILRDAESGNAECVCWNILLTWGLPKPAVAFANRLSCCLHSGSSWAAEYSIRHFAERQALCLIAARAWSTTVAVCASTSSRAEGDLAKDAAPSYAEYIKAAVHFTGQVLWCSTPSCRELYLTHVSCCCWTSGCATPTKSSLLAASTASGLSMSACPDEPASSEGGEIVPGMFYCNKLWCHAAGAWYMQAAEDRAPI